MLLESADLDHSAFLGFPKDVQQVIQRCQNHLSHMKNANFSDYSDVQFNHSEWISVDSYCPGVRSQSTVAHASMAVATVAMLSHLTMVISINSGLVKMYGPCLLLSLFFSSLHSAILFSAAYISNTDYLNLTIVNMNDDDIGVSQKYSTVLTKCWLADIISHYLVLAIHMAILMGLMERYHRMRRLFLNRIKLATPGLVTKSWILRSLSPNQRSRQSELHSGQTNRKPDNYSSGNNVKFKSLSTSLCSKPNSGKIKYSGRRTRFAQFKDNNNNYYDRSGFGLNSSSNRLGSRLWLIGQPMIIIILPVCPVSFGIWASEYLRLDSSWNPAYGYLTCGNIGGCIAANQWLIYIPLGLIHLLNITLIVTISLKTDTNCLVQEQCTSNHLESKAQFCMLAKMSLSYLFIWTIACVSNYICVGTLWQFYAICTGLQSLFIFVSFVFSRPFLEMVFKRDDPLGRLKLDSLAMQLPLGVLHNREPNPSMNFTTTAASTTTDNNNVRSDKTSKLVQLVNSSEMKQLK